MDLDIRISDEEIADCPTGVAARLEEVAMRIESGEFQAEAERGVCDLVRKIPRLRQHVLACAVRNLNAQRKYWSKPAGDWCFEPDGNVQMKAVVWIASYSDGLPTQTTLNLNVGANKGGDQGDVSDADLEAAVKASPALRDRLKAMLAKADGKAIDV